MAFTRIRRAASSSAATRVSPSTACLVTAYAPTAAMPVRPVQEAVLTRDPPSAGSGATVFTTTKQPTWLTRTTCMNSSSGVSTRALKRRMPAYSASTSRWT